MTDIERENLGLHPWQGVIRRLYAIGCAGCFHEDDGEFRDVRDAEQFWRRHGWHRRNTLWYCRDCGEESNDDR